MEKATLANLVILSIAAVFSQAEVKVEDVHLTRETVAGKGTISSIQKGSNVRQTIDTPYKPDELIVRFTPKPSGECLNQTDQGNKLMSSLGGGTIKRSFSLIPGLSVVRLPTGMTVKQALEKLGKTDGILYAEPDYKVRALSTFPNDPRFDDLWGMHNIGQTGGTEDADIDAPEAWDISTGSGDIIVAVIDTGVDYNHLDLVSNMWLNNGEIPDNGIDDDDNGYVDDVYGYDFCNNDADPMDDNYHGTHCAGTIGAAGNNSEGVAGICWNIQIMALKFLDSEGIGWSSDAISCIEYSVQMGAKVLSNSWGGEEYSHSLKEAIDRAGDAGVVFVAAAGNDGVNNDSKPHYPSSHNCENIIAVLSTDEDDNKSDFSCYGANSVDLGAPGSGILSCEPGNGYGNHSGTSMATPHVAGACALVLSLNSWLGRLEVKDILLQTVDPTLPGLCVSGGRLNLYQALLQVPPPGEGFIYMDEAFYSCSDTVNIEMGDFHLQGAGSHDANITTNGGDEETVTLIENTERLGIFSGAISTSTGPLTTGDGTLQVTHAETITATYYDANDGTGNPAIVQDTATVDCQPPSIFNIIIDKVGGTGARIEFETDEMSTGRIRCGLTCGGPYTTESTDFELAISHSIKVSGLASETTYYFVLDANDIVGNQTTDTNDGNCYCFTTTTIQVVYVPDDFNTIQAAIDNAWDGDTVIVRDGIYAGPGNQDIDFKGAAITVCSENGPEDCIIDCNGTEIEPHRGFYFHNVEGADSVLEGFTITHGYGELVCEEYGCVSCGGGIYCDSSSPTIRDCVIHDNSAGYSGGGIYNFCSSPTLSNCTFVENSAGEFGGGMDNRFQSNPTLNNCIFNRNSTNGCGGGMSSEDNSNATLANCAFNENIAGQGGGGMCNFLSSPTLTNCTFRGNLTNDYHGGGISNNGSDPILSTCIFTENSAAFFGGGMSNSGSCPILINCAFIGNSADLGGAISDVITIWDVNCPIHTNYKYASSQIHKSWTSDNSNNSALINCTLNSNSASHGGGVSNMSSNSSPVLSNCILWGNIPDEIYVVGKAPVVTYCNVEGGFPGTGNISVDPCFADTSSPDANEWDYHLQSQTGRWEPANQMWVQDDVNSPCIDAGDPNSDWMAELWPHGKRINMGVYGGTPQSSMSLSTIGNKADLNNSNRVDMEDLLMLAQVWLHQDVLLAEDINRDGTVDFTDFSEFGHNWLIDME